jgi:hypothetical protein
MFCDRCGAQMADTARFCPGCGKPFAAPAPMAPVAMNRVTRHVRNVGILWIVYSCIHLIPGLIVGSMPNWFYFDHGPFFLHGLFRAIGGLLVAKGIVGIIAGWGLLDRQSWARILAIILGFLSLLHFPLGTALGIYTLWVLLPAYSEMEYRQMARQ